MRARSIALPALLGVVLPAFAGGQELLRVLEGGGGLEQFGQACAAAGDLDGDGAEDHIVASPKFSTAIPNQTGRVRVFSGADQTVILDSIGPSPLGEFGFSVDAAGDVDADGVPDIIAGAPWDVNQGDTAGRARVISGKNGAVLLDVFGMNANATFGYAVSGAGDVNGDGYADVLVGSPGTLPRADLFSGIDGALLQGFAGVVASQMGIAVDGGADLTGDGVPDLVVGASLESLPNGNTGRVRVFSGATYAQVHDLYPDDSARSFGAVVRLSPDMTGDGIADLLVGGSTVYTGPTGPPYLNAIYLYDGASGARVMDVEGVQGLTGELGFAIASMPDTDGDGIPEVLSGAPYFEGATGLDRGAARVLSGADFTVLSEVLGDSDGDLLGHGVAPAGDVNEDGIPDFLAGAPLDDDSGPSAGRAFIYSPFEVEPTDIDIVLGDEIVGQLTSDEKEHRFGFTGLAGSVLKLKVKTQSGLAAVVTLRDDKDALLAQWNVSTFNKKVKLNAALPYSGDYVLGIESLSLQGGGYSIKTGRKLPKFAKKQKAKAKGSPTYWFFIDALPGAWLNLKIKPKGGDTPYQAMLVDPAGEPIDLSSAAAPAAPGTIKVPALLLEQLGRYTLRIEGIQDPKKVFKVTLKPKQPKGVVTHVIQ